MADTHLILDARRGVLRFRFLQLVAIALLGVIGLAVADLVFGLNPNAPDRGLSVSVRFGIALLSCGLAGLLIGAVLLAGGRYIVELRAVDTQLELVTLAPWGLRRRIVRPGELRLGAVHAPVMRTGQHVDAPWQTLRLARHRVPFIIDLQAAHYDAARLQAITQYSRKVKSPKR